MNPSPQRQTSIIVLTVSHFVAWPVAAVLTTRRLTMSLCRQGVVCLSNIILPDRHSGWVGGEMGEARGP